MVRIWDNPVYGFVWAANEKVNAKANEKVRAIAKMGISTSARIC